MCRQIALSIRPRNVSPLKLHFYIVTMDFAGERFFYLIFIMRAPRRGGSNIYPQSMF